MGVLVALIAAGAAMQYASKAEARRVVGETASLGELKPPEFRLRPAMTPAEFLAGTAATKRAVDEARKREPASGSAFGEPDAGD